MVKEKLREHTELQLDPVISKEMAEAGVELQNALLLVGPPGTGKTMLAEAVANEAGVPFIGVNAPELVEKWLGTTSANIRDLYELARKKAPCIDFNRIVDLTPENCTGRDITNICTEVWLKKTKDAKRIGKKVGELSITTADFEDVIASRSVTRHINTLAEGGE